MVQKTLILLKPDAVQKSLIGKIITRFEEKWLKVVWLKMMNLDDKLITEHYWFLSDKPFFPRIVSYMTDGPIVALSVEWEEAVATVRLLVGATNPMEATPGSIRADYAKNIDNNIIHASDSPETAAVELNRFFTVTTEIFDYKRNLID